MTISEQIQQLIELCSEHGLEPNRVRMSPKIYEQLNLEMLDEARQKSSYRGLVEWRMDKEIHGLAIEVAYDCPPDNIYVDHQPVMGRSYTSDEMAAMYGDAFMNDFFEQANEYLRGDNGA